MNLKWKFGGFIPENDYNRQREEEEKLKSIITEIFEQLKGEFNDTNLELPQTLSEVFFLFYYYSNEPLKFVYYNKNKKKKGTSIHLLYKSIYKDIIRKSRYRDFRYVKNDLGPLIIVPPEILIELFMKKIYQELRISVIFKYQEVIRLFLNRIDYQLGKKFPAFKDLSIYLKSIISEETENLTESNNEIMTYLRSFYNILKNNVGRLENLNENHLKIIKKVEKILDG